jgi:hypothetical protein
MWSRFHDEYKRRYGTSLTPRSDAVPPARGDLTGRPVDRVADEPAGLVDDDFREDRLAALVRMAVAREEITLGRAAEILGIDLVAMRKLADAWVG